MDPEGQSRDDLDVRLHWPGAEPDVAVGQERRTQQNGASTSDRSEHGRGQAVPPALSPRSTGPSGDNEAIRAALALIEARIDALGSAVEGARLPYHSALDAALDRLEHAVTALTRTVTAIDDRTTRSLHDILQRTEETAEQLEALRRRLALRARGEHLSPETIDKVAEAVAARLSVAQSWRRPRHT